MNGETSPFSAPPDADRIRVFDNYLQSIRHRVNGRIREVVEGNLYDDNLISFLLRGKRLRAAILLLVHDVISMEPERTEPRALDLACALELAHSASLIVDDIIDEDAERRGLETLHISRGTKMAMLASIGVLSLPYTLIAPYGGEYVSMIADVQRKMTRGVLREMSPIHACPATAWYEEVITQKTGHLFGLASEWGYMTAAWSDGTLSLVEVTSQKQMREKWRKYGICIGRSMQMADDIVDLRKRLRGETLGKAGSELLLLHAVGADGSIPVFFPDIRECGGHDASTFLTVRNPETILHHLCRRLRREGENAWEELQGIQECIVLPLTLRSLLEDLGYSIADIVLDEDTRNPLRFREMFMPTPREMPEEEQR